jgi:hypothetical protein
MCEPQLEIEKFSLSVQKQKESAIKVFVYFNIDRSF